MLLLTVLYASSDLPEGPFFTILFPQRSSRPPGTLSPGKSIVLLWEGFPGAASPGDSTPSHVPAPGNLQPCPRMKTLQQESFAAPQPALPTPVPASGPCAAAGLAAGFQPPSVTCSQHRPRHRSMALHTPSLHENNQVTSSARPTPLSQTGLQEWLLAAHPQWVMVPGTGTARLPSYS